MEGKSPKRTRGRSKSSANESSATQSGSADEEMAPNLNGNKDGGKQPDEETNENVPIKAEPPDSPELSKTAPEGSAKPSRKRKATDLKSEDSVEESNKEKEVSKEVTEDESASPTVETTNIKIEDESDLSESITDISVPEKQSLGKGKRARVPNKRYSDIIPSKVTFEPAKPKSTENGQLPESTQTDAQVSAEAKKVLHANKKFRSQELSNPNFLKPFQYGWKRELVYRATGNETNPLKRNGDIYYYTPNGKKVRSMREVAENLKNRELTIHDFTFFKEPIGLDDADKEIIRDAKLKNSPIVAKKMARVTKPVRVNSPRSTTASKPASLESPKSPSKPSTFKVKVPKGTTTKMKEKKIKVETPKDDGGDMEIGTYPPTWAASPPKKGKPNFPAIVETKASQPCSIQCEGVLGLIPTLQCTKCLCLYHNECVGIAPNINVQEYVCKNCQLEQEPITGAEAPAISTLPKLQKIPPTIPPPPIIDNILPELPKLTPKPGIIPNPEPNKSILGSVTTWFPPSSTIQVDNNENNNLETPVRPQLVEFVGNKKYLIVPRHNVLSVAPFSQSFNRTNIKVEPESPPKEPIPSTSSSPVPSGAPDHQELIEEANQRHPPTDNLEKQQDTPKTKTSARLRNQTTAIEKVQSPESKFMDTYLQNLAYGYKTLLCVFQYLKVQDLLRAGCVCTMWRDVARHHLLWSTVRMKNSQIHSFDGLANALRQHGTVHLDLRKMLLPSNGGDDIWPSFTNAIKKVETLRKIELCRCLASVVEDLALNNHNLEAINAVTIKCENMSFNPFKNLNNLTDLRLKSTAGFVLTSDLSALKELINLKHLSITSIKDLYKLDIEVIADLVNLEVLELGECYDFPENFGPDILSKLVKLEKLRLEKGQGDCHTFEMLEAVKELKALQQLELVNFDIKSGFDKALGSCVNIKKLLIIPTYISQSATTNHMVLGGVLKLQKTLSHFVWGVTLELLRVTELFVDQCESPDKNVINKDKNINNGDSIPVLKPVPLHGIPQPEIPPTSDTPQVEILPLPNLQKLLLQNLPTTRVKILKIPFHATWRQSITDSVN